jgi:hypothetical protein
LLSLSAAEPAEEPCDSLKVKITFVFAKMSFCSPSSTFECENSNES